MKNNLRNSKPRSYYKMSGSVSDIEKNRRKFNSIRPAEFVRPNAIDPKNSAFRWFGKVPAELGAFNVFCATNEKRVFDWDFLGEERRLELGLFRPRIKYKLKDGTEVTKSRDFEYLWDAITHCKTKVQRQFSFLVKDLSVRFEGPICTDNENRVFFALYYAYRSGILRHSRSVNLREFLSSLTPYYKHERNLRNLGSIAILERVFGSIYTSGEEPVIQGSSLFKIVPNTQDAPGKFQMLKNMSASSKRGREFLKHLEMYDISFQGGFFDQLHELKFARDKTKRRLPGQLINMPHPLRRDIPQRVQRAMSFFSCNEPYVKNQDSEPQVWRCYSMEAFCAWTGMSGLYAQRKWKEINGLLKAVGRYYGNVDYNSDTIIMTYKRSFSNADVDRFLRMNQHVSSPLDDARDITYVENTECEDASSTGYDSAFWENEAKPSQNVTEPTSANL